MTEHLVFIEFAGRVLAFPATQVQEAAERGLALFPHKPDASNGVLPPEKALTDHEIAAKTGVPATWFLEQARLEAIPHIRLGKYRRFLFTEVIESAKFKERQEKVPGKVKQRLGLVK